MSRNSVPRLGGALIARKGEAAPAVPVVERTGTDEVTAQAPVPRGVGGTIAVTVRLDPVRYERLKILGVKTRRTNQDILIEALDALLEKLT